MTLDEAIAREEKRRAGLVNENMIAASDALLRMMYLSRTGGGKRMQLNLFYRKKNGS